MRPGSPHRYHRVARHFAVHLQACFENIGEAEMGIDERDVGRGEQRRVRDLVRKYGKLLVGRETRVVVQRDGRLLGQQSIGDYGIAVVQTVQVLIEHAEAAADHGFADRLPGKSKSRRNALVLVREPARQREGGVGRRLGIKLKILAYSKIQRQVRPNLIRVVEVEADVGDIERELGLASALKKIVVDAEGEVRQAGKAIRSAEGTILRLRVGI